MPSRLTAKITLLWLDCIDYRSCGGSHQQEALETLTLIGTIWNGQFLQLLYSPFLNLSIDNLVIQITVMRVNI